MQLRSASSLALGLGIAGALAALSSPAQADRRTFTRTYEYTTMPAGQTELEIYSTQGVSEFRGGAPRTFELQLELEHGITDHFDVALYHVFTQVSAAEPAEAQDLQFSALKLRGRYRFAERGELPVDMVAYVEAAKDFGVGVYELEGKFIAARDFGDVLTAANAIFELEFGDDTTETEVELGWSIGAAYEVLPALRFGVETYGAFEAAEPEEVAAYLGPTASWGSAGKLWVAGTLGFGLNDEANAFSGRMILGIDL